MSKPQDTIKAFVEQRDKLLTEMDLDKIRAFYTMHGVQLPDDNELLTVTIHKARTAATSLPLETRQASKTWLSERNYSSLDDGGLQ